MAAALLGAERVGAGKGTDCALVSFGFEQAVRIDRSGITAARVRRMNGRLRMRDGGIELSF